MACLMRYVAADTAVDRRGAVKDDHCEDIGLMADRVHEEIVGICGAGNVTAIGGAGKGAAIGGAGKGAAIGGAGGMRGARQAVEGIGAKRGRSRRHHQR